MALNYVPESISANFCKIFCVCYFRDKLENEEVYREKCIELTCLI